MIISDLIKIGSETLKKREISSHLLDSELLLSRLLKCSREKLLTSEDQMIPKTIELDFNKLISRRFKNEPVAYIFIVSKDTLIPRPETELLVEKILKYFCNKKPFILDIGSGSGCIILTLLQEIKKSYGFGIDVSKKALKISIKNAIKLGLESKIKFYNRSLEEIYGYKFDLIVSNPPYICSNQIKNLTDDIKKYEPRVALDGGNDGLDVIKKVIYKSKSILKRKGMLALEIGNGHYKKVSQILKLQGFRNKFLIKDYKENIRCILTILES